jgi:hypothetical protein
MMQQAAQQQLARQPARLAGCTTNRMAQQLQQKLEGHSPIVTYVLLQSLLTHHPLAKER